MGPFTFLRRFAEQMDRLFDDLGFGPSPDIQLLSRGAPMWSPPVETFERDDRLVVRVDLPGLKPSDVDVELTDDGLVIQGERREEREQREGGHYRTERRYGTFVRLVPLPEGIDPEKIEASFRDGVLEVAVPLSEAQSRRRRIEIRGAQGPETSASRGAATGASDPAARETPQGKSAGTGKTGEARK
jgi:HSP20 family protein